MKKLARRKLKLTRRTFVVGSAAVAGGLAITSGSAQNRSYEVAIVGAGMAGLYAAWRLVVQSKSIDPSDVCIIEMTDRIGGRLDTFTFPAGTTAELGGMRFGPDHQLVTKLVKHFDLKTLNFPQTDNRLYYLRSKQIWQKEMHESRILPYRLLHAEQRMTPDHLLNYAIGNAIGNPPGWQSWNWDQWQTFFKSNTYFSPRSGAVPVYNGVRYSDVGFWNLLTDQLSNEGNRYVADGGGYDSNVINWNAAIALPYMVTGDYGPGAEYQRIEGGYQKLPEALNKALIDANVAIHRNTRLVRFANDQNGLIDCTVDHADNQRQFKTRKLFLCMPRRSIELLDPETDFSIKMRAKQYVESVIRQPSFKLLFLYRDRWYRKVQIRGKSIKPFGPTITDLPLRMIWYFDPDPSNTCWTLLASYCDMASVEFWRVMEEVPAPPGFPGSRKPTKEMIEMARSQLQRVHGVDIPEPEDAVFQDWGLDPYGAGYHAWAPHYVPSDMFNSMIQPISSYNVFICGEAYSLDQGWVEGALKTVEKCLNRLSTRPYSLSVSPDASTSIGLRRL